MSFDICDKTRPLGWPRDLAHGRVWGILDLITHHLVKIFSAVLSLKTSPVPVIGQDFWALLSCWRVSEWFRDIYFVSHAQSHRLELLFSYSFWPGLHICWPFIPVGLSIWNATQVPLYKINNVLRKIWTKLYWNWQEKWLRASGYCFTTANLRWKNHKSGALKHGSGCDCLGGHTHSTVPTSTSQKVLLFSDMVRLHVWFSHFGYELIVEGVLSRERWDAAKCDVLCGHET